VLAITLEAYGDDEETEHEQEVGTATPGAFAALGVAFICCAILIAGMPPLSGFLGKFAIIRAMFELGGGTAVGAGVWVVIAALVASGLAATIALMRSGINTFWVSLEGGIPAIRWVEIAPILLLLGLGVALTVFAHPALGFMQTASASVYAPAGYIEAVLGSAGGQP